MMMANSSLDRRSQILRAAVTAFARHGYSKTSMESIASETGISRPALYQYYSNKTEIFRASVAWVTDGVVHRAHARSASVDDREKTLLQLMDLIADLYREPEFGRIRAEMIEETYDRAGDLWESFEHRMAAILADVLAGDGSSDTTRERCVELASVLLYGTEGILLKSRDGRSAERISMLARLVAGEANPDCPA